MPRAARASPDASRCTTLDRSRLADLRTSSLRAQTVAGLERALVPGVAGLVLLESRPGIDDQQRANALRMRAVKRQRHVAAQ